MKTDFEALRDLTGSVIAALEMYVPDLVADVETHDLGSLGPVRGALRELRSLEKIASMDLEDQLAANAA